MALKKALAIIHLDNICKFNHERVKYFFKSKKIEIKEQEVEKVMIEIKGIKTKCLTGVLTKPKLGKRDKTKKQTNTLKKYLFVNLKKLSG